MAISQTKYIDIASKIATSPIGNRDFSGLVFTDDEMLSEASNKTAYDNGDVIALSTTGISASFNTAEKNEAKVYKFASKYFSYVSATGKSPRTLYVAKILEGDTPTTAIERAINSFGNFGSFTFLPKTNNGFAIAALKDAYGKSSDFKYLAVHGEKATAETDGSFSFDTATGNAGTLGKMAGVHFVVGADDYAAAIPMSILASINYDNGVNSVVNFMFRSVSGEIPTVTNDSDYDDLSLLYINFYGQTQANGVKLSFYQRGFNLDGVDTGIYCNEMWLRSAIAESFLNFLSSVNRIPANYVGAGMIRNAIIGEVTQAVKNGTILIGKTLTDMQKALVYQYTDDELAWEAVQNEGYWLDVVISSDGDNYNAVYRLVYSKGDSIRFIDGTHILV